MGTNNKQENKHLSISVIAEVEDITKFKMRGNRILVRPAEEDCLRTSGGIIIPEQSADKMLKSGTVISVGPQVTDIKEGDTVFFNKMSDDGMVRQGNDIYIWYADYAIVATLDNAPMYVESDGTVI